jgi:hypothetical protein
MAWALADGGQFNLRILRIFHCLKLMPHPFLGKRFLLPMSARSIDILSENGFFGLLGFLTLGRIKCCSCRQKLLRMWLSGAE